MPEQNIDTLRERWEVERSRGLTLELAGEHRRRGEPSRALEVLAADLEIHPEHVAARVAKGRCHLDLDQVDEAGRELGQAAIEDPAHLDANRLLAEVHIRLGNLDRARDRLDLFELLGGDAALLEALEERLEGAAAEPAGAAPAAEPEAPGAVEDGPLAAVTEALPTVEAEPAAELESAATVEPEVAEVPAASRPELPAAGPAAPEAAAAEPFELPTPRPPAPTVGREELSPVAAGRPARGAGGGDGADPDPFVLLDWIDFDESRYQAALFVEGLFSLPGGVRAAAPAASAAVAGEAGAPTPEPAPTLTLGELYRKQGHRAEAAGIFRQILERQPGNVRAARALRELEKEGGWPLSAEDLLGGPDRRPAGGSAADLLRRYRDRLRGSE